MNLKGFDIKWFSFPKKRDSFDLDGILCRCQPFSISKTDTTTAYSRTNKTRLSVLCLVTQSITF